MKHPYKMFLIGLGGAIGLVIILDILFAMPFVINNSDIYGYLLTVIFMQFLYIVFIFMRKNKWLSIGSVLGCILGWGINFIYFLILIRIYFKGLP